MTIGSIQPPRLRDYRQVMFPEEFSAGMRGSDVRVTFEDDVIRLKFGRAMFDVEEQAVAR